MIKVKEVKDKVKVSTVFQGEDITLESTGKYSYKCLCPFHDETRASCAIDDRKGIFKCFSCGAGGDILNFIDLQYPGMHFKNRLNYIYNKYIKNAPETELVSSLQGQRAQNFQDDKDFREIMNYIAKYCSEKLPSKIYETYMLSSKNISYSSFKGEVKNMSGYRLSDKIVKDFLIGYMPNNKELYNHLLQKFSKELIERTQLFSTNGMPKFRNRIVIPYFKDGDVVYFTARQTELTPPGPYDTPKYLNQNIDNKYLYNEDDIDNSTVFITEGAFDCLALKSIGYNAIALGGVEGTRKLTSYYKELEDCYFVYICFDNDGNTKGAGNIQSQKLDEILRKNNINSHQVLLPLQGEKKIDISEYLGTHSKQEFDKLLTF